MNAAYVSVLAASEEDRRGLFAATARRIGSTEQNVEKDFWACWALDALFHELPHGGPRLLFKGGTSLSKAFGLIQRFSEDVDITVFRADLGLSASPEELEKLTGKKRQARLDAIKNGCRQYIQESLRPQLKDILAATMKAAGTGRGDSGVILDDSDDDGQTILVRFPSVVTARDSYVPASIKIESGAKSALDPHVTAAISPFVAAEIPGNRLRVEGVRTIEPARTFWDKVIILHGLRRWFEIRGELRQEGQRVSRHYYDLHCLLAGKDAAAIKSELPLAAECVRHARMFFDRPDFDLVSAKPGSFALLPTPAMLKGLKRDYERMAGMIFGVIPPFGEVMVSVARLEKTLNQ